MNTLLAVVVLAFVSLAHTEVLHKNSFDIIRGCKQYPLVMGYNDPLEYFPTKNLDNVGRTGGSKYFRLAVVGPNDGIIRYGSSLFPYGMNVTEIVLGGYANKWSMGRTQFRTSANKYTNLLRSEVQTPGLLSQYRPTMFVIEVFDNGTVEVRIDGQQEPFLKFTDDNRTPTNYMTFTKWNKEVILFYDCPVEGVKLSVNQITFNGTVV